MTTKQFPQAGKTEEHMRDISSGSLSRKLAGKMVENSSARCLPVGSINGNNNVAIYFLLPTLLVVEKTMLKNELHLTLQT